MAEAAEQHNSLAGVRIRLKEWGEWLRAGAGHNLGMPSIAAHLATHTTGRHDGYVPHAAAEEIDRILLAMKRKHPVMFKVIEQEYYWQAITKVGADRLRVSVATFKNRRLSAEYWVDAHLTKQA